MKIGVWLFVLVSAFNSFGYVSRSGIAKNKFLKMKRKVLREIGHILDTVSTYWKRKGRGRGSRTLHLGNWWRQSPSSVGKLRGAGLILKEIKVLVSGRLDLKVLLGGATVEEAPESQTRDSTPGAIHMHITRHPCSGNAQALLHWGEALPWMDSSAPYPVMVQQWAVWQFSRVRNGDDPIVFGLKVTLGW